MILYTLLSLLNLFGFLYFSEWNYEFLIIYAGFIINQVFLTLGVKRLLSEEKKDFRVAIYLTGKFFVLGGVIFWGVTYSTISTKIIVLSYIFQLLILVISITKYSKK